MDMHAPGDPQECFSIPIVLHKDAETDERGAPVYEENGKPRYRCGFRIGGGIDQDPSKSPQGYPDKGVYVTFIYENGPAHRAGLEVHDKLLQVNGHDMTMVTHKKACDYVKRKPVLNMLVYRKGLPNMPKPQQQQPSAMDVQFQGYNQGFNQGFNNAPPPGHHFSQQQGYREY